MTDTALVLGGTGFFGNHLVRSLLDTGRRVVVVTRKSSTVPPDFYAAHIISSDDWSRDALSRLLEKERFGSVFNLASYGVNPKLRDPVEMHLINVDLPVTLAMIASEHNARLILAGSCAEYARPESETPVTEKHPLETRHLYGATKAAGGIAALANAVALNVPAMLLRLFNVYGPGEAPHRLLPSLLTSLLAGKRVSLSPGTQLRDFVYVSDAVDALLAAERYLESRDIASIIPVANVATGSGRSVRDFCRIAAEKVGADVALLGFGDRPMRLGEVPKLVGDPSVFKSATGWSARNSLETGIGNSLMLLGKLQEAKV